MNVNDTSSEWGMVLDALGGVSTRMQSLEDALAVVNTDIRYIREIAVRQVNFATFDRAVTALETKQGQLHADLAAVRSDFSARQAAIDARADRALQRVNAVLLLFVIILITVLVGTLWIS